MANRQKLSVTKRTLVGRKAEKLRKQGILPANIYGKDIKSMIVELPLEKFQAIYKEVGETGLIDLDVAGELKPVLIHNVQLNHLSKIPVHADFYQVNLKEKVKTMVPIEVVGEPKAVTEKVGILMQTLNEVEVEALPADLPEKIEVNVESLAAVDQQITVSGLKKLAGVEVLTDASQVVVKIAELISEEAKADAQAAEAAAAQTATETVEGEAENAEEVKTEGAEAESKEAAEKPKDVEK